MRLDICRKIKGQNENSHFAPIVIPLVQNSNFLEADLKLLVDILAA